MENELVLVDIFDNELGYADKKAVHRQPLLHRAFSIFIVDETKMLMQKRNVSKYHSGGKWTNACCSHPYKGENINSAIRRAMINELGISCFVDEIFEFIYFSKYSDKLFEYEYDHVYVGKLASDTDICHNTEEIDEIKWEDIDSLCIETVEKPEKFTTWFLMAFPRVVQYVNGQ